MTSRVLPPDMMDQLECRLGSLQARQRLAIERDYEERIFGPGLHFFHVKKWYSAHGVIAGALKLMGLYGRGRRNACDGQVRRHVVRSRALPPAFDGFTILHISDPHVDLNPRAVNRIIDLLPNLAYDICVLTGDYRGHTYGPFEHTLEVLARIRTQLTAPVYGVLGNHDSVRMVPGLEDLGIQMLINEVVSIARGPERIHVAGIDDAHSIRLDDIDKVASEIPADGFSILLSHTPEVYRQAAHAGFDLLLGGAHSRRPDLPYRRHSHYARCGSAQTHGCRIVAVSCYGWLHVRGRRIVHCTRALQLSPRDHLTSPHTNH